MQKVFVYRIFRHETGDAYVGSSVHPPSRWVRHKSSLNCQKHHSPHLQRAWNRYGADAFDFEVLAEQNCSDRAARLAFELSWIAKSGQYNVLQPNAALSHFICSPESIKKRSAAARLRIASDPVYKATLEARGKLLSENSKSPKGRANMAKHTARRWADPLERKKLSSGLTNRWSEPNAHSKHAAKISKAHSTPEMKAIHAANTAALWKTDEYRNKVQKKAALNRWGDPATKEIQARKIREYHARRRQSKIDA